MPLVTMPNGDKVRFPDEMPRDQISTFIEEKFPGTFTKAAEPQQATEAPFSLGGTAKAFGTGVKQGAIGLAGLPSDAIYGARWLARKAGLPTVETPLPGSEEIGAAVNKVIPDYQPQNVLEEYAATTGSLAPAIASGPGGLIRKGVATLGSGAATEGVGQALRANAPEYEQAGRVATAVATGGLAAAKRPAVTGPSTASWLKTAKDDYQFLDKSGVGLSRPAMQRLETMLQSKLRQEGYDPDFHTGVNSFLKLVGNKTGKGHVPFSEWQNMRTDAGALIGNATDRRFVRPLKDTLDDFWANLSAKDMSVMGLPPGPQMASKAAQLAGRAKRAYFMGKKGELLDRIEKSIGNRASQYSVSGMENALRTEMRGLSKRLEGTSTASRLLKATFTPKERARIDQMANSLSLAGLTRTLGKYNIANTIAGGTVGAGSIIGSLISGDPRPAVIGTAALAIGGGIRGLGNRSARRQWQDFAARAKGGVQPQRTAGQLAQPVLRGGAVNGTEAVSHTQNVLGPEAYDNLGRDPATRGQLAGWLKAKATGKGAEEAAIMLADSIAQKVNRPELADRIARELLGGQQ